VDARDRRGHDDIGLGSTHETTMTASHRVPDLGQMLREAVTLQQHGRLREAERSTRGC
jgi:hypothetical protein